MFRSINVNKNVLYTTTRYKNSAMVMDTELTWLVNDFLLRGNMAYVLGCRLNIFGVLTGVKMSVDHFNSQGKMKRSKSITFRLVFPTVAGNFTV